MSLLVIIGILTISQASVFAATDTTTGLRYSISNGKATITGFSAPTGFGGTLTIPGTLGGATVTAINSYAFGDNEAITSAVIPKSVLSIGINPFDGCLSLTSITVDPSNTAYKSLDNILFYKDGTTIVSCPAAKSGSVTIPNGVTTIADFAFSSCSKMTGITLPDSLKSIGYLAFYDCSGLTNLTIPGGVANIDSSMVAFCGNLTSINIDSSNSTYKSIDGMVFSKSGTTFVCCPEGKSGYLTIPDGVTSIESMAFAYCQRLKGITIPVSVTSIGDYAFGNCSVLLSMTVPNSVTSIGRGAFFNCFSLASITIPNSITSIEDYTFQFCGKLERINLPSSIKTIGQEAFYYCSKLTGITIPASVTSIGEDAFTDCVNLKDAYFYGNSPEMGSSVFHNCASGFVVHYQNTSTGFANPWNGYTTAPFTAAAGVSYQTHVQDIGWQDYVMNGVTAGTSGQSKRLEGIKIKLNGISGGIEYKTHVQDIGWQDWVQDDALSGTIGQSKRLEAIEIRLTGEAANLYDVYYCVHSQNIGWMDWAKNGEPAGTAGYSYRLEAIQIVLIKKGDAAPGPMTTAFIGPSRTEPVGDTVSYKTHVQDIGWMDYVSNGITAGTCGQSKRMEAIQIKLQNMAGGIEYKTHVQDIGWMDWVSNDAVSGTSGQSKRLEAIQIRLTGEAADNYDIYYRVHAQNLGWMDWAKNGDPAGTAGYSYRLEAIEIVLVPKDCPAPGPIDKPFVQA